MIIVGEEGKKATSNKYVKSFIVADTQLIESKHTGKYISNLNFDVSQITRMLSEAFLSVFKDGLTLNRIINCYVYSKLEAFFNCDYNDSFSFHNCKSFSKKNGQSCY